MLCHAMPCHPNQKTGLWKRAHTQKSLADSIILIETLNVQSILNSISKVSCAIGRLPAMPVPLGLPLQCCSIYHQPGWGSFHGCVQFKLRAGNTWLGLTPSRVLPGHVPPVAAYIRPSPALVPPSVLRTSHYRLLVLVFLECLWTAKNCK